MEDASKSREIRSVLATVLYQPDEIEQLRRAFAPAEFVHVHPRESAAIEAALEHADVAILQWTLMTVFSQPRTSSGCTAIMPG